jgi:predicted O-linked N-acetylglucosamine transferase (SPINDLY family)
MTTQPSPYPASDRLPHQRLSTEESSHGSNFSEAALLSEALDLHRQGRLAEARIGYEKILSRRPDHSDALNLMGALEQKAGNLEAALRCLEKAAGLAPQNGIYLNNLGNALKDAGEFVRAETCYCRAADFDPGNPNPLYNLAALLQGQDRLDEALAWYEKALTLAPDDAAALNNLGALLRAQGKMDQAESVYRKLLTTTPNHVKALFNLGSLLCDQDRFEEAEASFRAALLVKPDYTEALLGLGRTCREAGRLDEARKAYSRALRIRPDSADAHFNLGNIHKDLGRFEDAATCYRQALAINPNFAEALCNLGSAFKEMGKADTAMACYRRALDSDPDFAEVYNNMSVLHTEQGRIGEAIDCCKRAQALRADFAESYNNLARALKYSGRAKESIIWYERSLALAPEKPFVHSNLLYSLSYLEDVSPEAVNRAHRYWARSHGATVTQRFKDHPNTADPQRCLRVGYVSPDFRRHPVATFIEPVLAEHDRSAVEVICFSEVRKKDVVTRRLRQLADRWFDTAGIADPQLAEMIRTAGVDILVDLAGHTAGNRMPLFSLHPAPVQVTYLGYPNTTGLSTVDYRITDAWADPPGQTEAWHTEEFVRLDNGFLCYTPPEAAPEVGPPPHLKTGGVTFGSFNNLAKFNAGVASLWAAVLKAVPGSRLIMKFKTLSDPEVRQTVIDAFAANDVSSERLSLHGFLPSFTDHFALYNRIDIALDTVPYNGTTTTCEALWMGVPVMTLAGRTHAARVGVSILTGLGLSELVAQSRDDYVEKAAALARDWRRLDALRKGLRLHMQASPFMDGPGFARRLECAYRAMWRRWCALRA